MELVGWLNPASVLDVGTGFGKYGVLCREYLDVNKANRFGERNHRIDGIEAYREYLTPLHAYVYDEVYVGDALKIIPTLDREYGLILLIDVLEHLSFEGGTELLDRCKSRGRNMIISTPLDIGHQGGVFGNEYETHRAQWTKNRLKSLGDVLFLPNKYSVICFTGADIGRVRRCYNRESRGIKPFVALHFPTATRAYHRVRRGSA
jgi:hypothetical protein